MGPLSPLRWHVCNLLRGYWFMATFWLGFKYLRSFFLSKVRAERSEETWPGSCRRRLGAPVPGAVPFPGCLADAIQDPRPGCVSAVLGAGGAGLGPPGARSGPRVLWPSSGVLSPVPALFERAQ